MHDDNANLRKLVYALLITVAAGMIAGRIAATERVYEPSLHRDESDPKSRGSRWPTTRPRPMPTFSSNDRARWATIRALIDGETAAAGDEGTHVVGRRDRKVVFGSAITPLAAHDGVTAAALMLGGYHLRTRSDSGIIFEDGYQSVDKVLHPQTFEFYSTKPPLVPTLLAGLYWLVQLLTGWTLANNPAEVVRTILLLVNLLPFVIYLILTARLVERYGTTDWGRLFVMTAACFGTYVTTFAITLSNHTPATYSVLFALFPFIAILERKTQTPNVDPPWYLFVVCGFFAAFAFCNELPALAFAAALGVVLLRWAPRPTVLYFLPPVLLMIAAYFYVNYVSLGQWKPIQSQFGSIWYEFEGSHWRKAAGEVRHGIDWAGYKESRWEYALHLLFGHHGLFSLTPLWLLSLPGMLLLTMADLRYWLFRTPAPADNAATRRRVQALIGAITLTLTLAVVAFYLYKSDNYGGFTSGLRWLMWLTPLWLFTLLPMADRLAGQRWGRTLGCVLLGFSVLSVSYPAWNPWRHPWIYNLLTGLGWPGY